MATKKPLTAEQLAALDAQPRTCAVCGCNTCAIVVVPRPELQVAGRLPEEGLQVSAWLQSVPAAIRVCACHVARAAGGSIHHGPETALGRAVVARLFFDKFGHPTLGNVKGWDLN